MNVLSDYIPQSVNSGAWLTAYTLNELKVRIPGQRIVLPICSLGTPFDELARLGELSCRRCITRRWTRSFKRTSLHEFNAAFPITRERAKPAIALPRSNTSKPARSTGLWVRSATITTSMHPRCWLACLN